MIDTIHIELPYRIDTSLKKTRDVFDRTTGELLSSVGFIECIKIRSYINRTKIECSLSKLLNNNNLYSLSYPDVLKAISLIEKVIGVSIKEGIIRRIDLESTIVTNLKPIEYFRHLGNAKYFIRTVTGSTSIYYKNNSREINIYDKIKEMKNKGLVIPRAYKHYNLLRIECRYKNGFIKRFAAKNNLKNLTVNNLINASIYLSLLELAFNDYNSINKVEKLIASRLSLCSKKNLVNQLAYIGVESLGGVLEVEDMINASKPYNIDIPKEYPSRRKLEVRQLMKESNFSVKSNTVDELDRKVELVLNSRKRELEKYKI